MIFSSEQTETLKTLGKLWKSRPLVLIGAAALNHQLPMAWRQTHDLDLTIAADVTDLPLGLDELQGWKRSAKLEQRWSSPVGVNIDIVPAGRIPDQSETTLVWPQSGNEMNLSGLELAFEYQVSLPLDTNHEIKAATIPVLVVLKMAAYLDRPSERQRDLEDICHVMEAYLETDDVPRYAPEIVVRGLDFDQTNAYLLGVDVGDIIRSVHRPVVEGFLRRVGDPVRAEHHQMARLGPASWGGDVVHLAKLISAFEMGISD